MITLTLKKGDTLNFKVEVLNKNSKLALEKETLLNIEKNREVINQDALDNAQTEYDNAIKVDVSDWGIKSKISYGFNQINIDLTVEKDSTENNVFYLKYNNTNTLNELNYLIDIEITENSEISSTDTFNLQILKDIA